MKHIFVIGLLLFLNYFDLVQAQPNARMRLDFAKSVVKYKPVTDKIISAARHDSSAYNRLAELCDTFGSRFSGSESLENSIDWILAQMKKDGFDNVHLEDAMVPKWVRGQESCEMMSPQKKPMAMLGLGGSIATQPDGITAEVMLVHSFAELEKRSAEAKGKIVLFNVKFTKYGETVQYRVGGAVAAGKVGAVASLVRAVGPFGIQTPHTGGMYYNDSVRKIPHASITLEDAEMIERMIKRGQKISVHLTMSAKTEPDVLSHNIIAEIRGSEKPEEVVVFGGHTDSWDVGQGAMDDGGGVVAAWQALKILKELGLRPKRTIRVVGWVNEENGLRGAKAYAKLHENEKHIIGIESDEGVFSPRGFAFEGNDSIMAKAQAVAKLLRPIGKLYIRHGETGADTSPLVEKGIPGLNLETDDSKYFWYHHTQGDTMDKLSPDEINNCVATLAVMAYCFAELP